jgi:hypothetical protein
MIRPKKLYLVHIRMLFSSFISNEALEKGVACNMLACLTLWSNQEKNGRRSGRGHAAGERRGGASGGSGERWKKMDSDNN